MSINSEASDLALIKNQNELAIQFTALFSLQELLLIDLDNISVPNYCYNMNILYKKDYIDKNNDIKTISILDIQLIESKVNVKSNRYIFIRYQSNNYQIDFKYRYSKNIIKYIALSIKQAINFINFKNPGDTKIIKKNIVYNAAEVLSSKYELEVLEEINYIIYDIISKKNIYETGFEYSKPITDSLTVAIETMEYYIIFGIYDSSSKDLPFLFFVDKKALGLSALSVLSETSINNKK